MSQVEGSAPQPDSSGAISPDQAIETPVDFSSTKHRVKIDGNELEVPYDELLSGYQMSRASKMRFDEAAKMRKGVEDFVTKLKDGDFSILEEFVPKENIRSWAERELSDYIEWEELPQSEKDKIIAIRERDELKNEVKSLKQAEQEKIILQAEQEAEAEIDNEIYEAIQSIRQSSGNNVPITAELVQDIARLMLSHLQEGNERPSAKDATKKIMDRYRKKFGSYVSSLSVDDLRSVLSSDQLNALRKMELDQAMSSMENNIRHIKSDTKTRKQREKMNVDDFFSKMDKKYRYGE